MKPLYRVTLSSQEREELEALTKTNKTNARQFLYARTLLLCDAGTEGPAWKVGNISEAMGVTPRMIEHLKKRFVEEGLAATLRRKEREKPPREIIFDGAFEARLITLACSKAPEGRQRWTIRLLAEKAVELSMETSVSPMTVHRILKKTNLNLISGSIGKYHQKKVLRS